MGDRYMNDFAPVANAEYVYAEDADRNQVKIRVPKMMENGGIYHFYERIDAGNFIVLPYIAGLIIVQEASSTHTRGCAILNSDNTGTVLRQDGYVNFFSEIPSKICVFNTGVNTNYVIKNTHGVSRVVSLVFVS